MRILSGILVVLAGVAGLAHPGQAATICQGKTLIVYGNGMYATPDDAHRSMWALETGFKSYLPASSTL